MLSPQTIETVKKITPLVADNADTIARRFYVLMFEGNPEVKAYFNEAYLHSGQQQKSLAGAICSCLANLDDLPVLTPGIESIAQKHCSLEIQPEHFPIFGKHLLAAIKEAIGDAGSDETMAAVAEAYQVLADTCIDREQEIYQQQKSIPGGWNGYRKFIVDRKEPESEVVTSFYLKPADGAPLPAFLPGQFVTVRIDHPTTPTAPRNYSLSDRPGNEHFRISVKRESGISNDTPAGLVSTYLHDVIQVGDQLELGPPCGEFAIDPDQVSERPIVLLAGGIGVTPLISMARTLVHEGVAAPIHFLQAAKNSRVHAFADEVCQLISDKDFVEIYVVYDEPLEGDIEQGKCDRAGRIDKALLREWTPFEEAEFYCCGPKPFMSSIYADLTKLGVGDSRINFEFFGPREPIGVLAETI